MYLKFKIFIFLLCLLACSPTYYDFKHIPVWWYNKGEVTAVVYEVIRNPETVFLYNFYVDGKKYKGGYSFFECVEGIVIGSKFKVFFNPKNPNENYIVLHKPVFEANEEFGFTNGKLIITLVL